MRHEPVHKPKAVVFGPTIVYDAERCIMCTRCVRVVDEVAKDPVLDMRERGNLERDRRRARAAQLDHHYTLMTEHVCPVGALTVDGLPLQGARVVPPQRAQRLPGLRDGLQRVPRLRSAQQHGLPRTARATTRRSTSTGCATRACSRTSARVESAPARRRCVGGEDATHRGGARRAAKEQLKGTERRPSKVAIVLSAQHSIEDNFALLTLARRPTSARATSSCPAGRSGRGDDILMSEDKNPNTRGVMGLVAVPHPRASSTPRPLAEPASRAIEAGKYAYAIAPRLGRSRSTRRARRRRALSKLKGFVIDPRRTMVRSRSAAHIVLPAVRVGRGRGHLREPCKGLAQNSEQGAPAGAATRGPAGFDRAAQGARSAMRSARHLTELHRAMPAGSFAAAPAQAAGGDSLPGAPPEATA